MPAASEYTARATESRRKIPRNLAGAATLTARSPSSLQCRRRFGDRAEQAAGAAMIAALEMVEKLFQRQLRANDGIRLRATRDQQRGGGNDDAGNRGDGCHDADDGTDDGGRGARRRRHRRARGKLATMLGKTGIESDNAAF